MIYCYADEDWEKAFVVLAKSCIPMSSNWRNIFIKIILTTIEKSKEKFQQDMLGGARRMYESESVN